MGMRLSFWAALVVGCAPGGFANAAPGPLIDIPAGTYRPLLPGKNEPKKTPVAAFRLDRQPVTEADFKRFVQAVNKWRPGTVPALFADANYLSHWAGPERLKPSQPIVHVSYFAADAYCAWRDARLPTTAEWEYVGAASATSREGRDDPKYNARILEWYGRPATAERGTVRSQAPNVFGVYDMHGLIWEWTSDFNSVLVTGESRGDSSLERGLFCGAGALGAADPSDYAAFMRTAFRSSLDGRYAGVGLGFRCAQDAHPSSRSNAPRSKGKEPSK